MSDDETTDVGADEPTITTAFTSEPEPTTPPPETSAAASEESLSKFRCSIQSLSSIILISTTSTSNDPNPALSLLHDAETSSQISSLLRRPDSGAGDNNLCRWLYDTFQSNDPSLQLVVLRFVPTIAGLYLSRVPLRRPLAGFEAVLLALYAYVTTARAGQPVTVNVPDLSHPSLYHESAAPARNNATALNLAVVSPSLEPHGTVRSTRRARIVGVALELYYSKISLMPADSKLDFCEFCRIWAGSGNNNAENSGTSAGGGEDAGDEEGEKMVSIINNNNNNEDNDSEGTSSTALHDQNQEGREKIREGRIPLPWELLQPVMRILGHCLMGGGLGKHIIINNNELVEAAMAACKSLYRRSLHDIDAKGILATESLIRLGKMALDPKDGVVDPTEISMSNIISI